MGRKSLKNVAKLIDRANKKIPVQEQFLDDLKKSIEITDIKESRKPSQAYKPSGMNCIRSMFYQVVGAETESDSNYVMVGICEAGTDRHERIQNAISKMKENGFDCEYIDVGDYVKSRGLDSYLNIVDKCGNETKLYDKERNISFLCDGIIKYQGKYYIVEFKTESSFKWRDRTGVDPKHFNQARTYSLELQIDEVIFVYINRDIVDMKAYLYKVTDEERENIIRLIGYCDEYVEHKTLPPKPEDASNKKCAYCAYKKLCDGDDNGIKE